MINNQNIYLTAIVILISGCVHVRESKSIIVTPEPGQTEVLVESNVSARCRDILGIISCNTNIDLHQVKRENPQASSSQQSEDEPEQSETVPKQPVVTAQKLESKTFTRLNELEQLRKEHIISEPEYQKKRKQILDEL